MVEWLIIACFGRFGHPIIKPPFGGFMAVQRELRSLLDVHCIEALFGLGDFEGDLVSFVEIIE